MPGSHPSPPPRSPAVDGVTGLGALCQSGRGVGDLQAETVHGGGGKGVPPCAAALLWSHRSCRPRRLGEIVSFSCLKSYLIANTFKDDVWVKG